MPADVMEAIDHHLAQAVSVEVTQGLVRTDSTNGKESVIGHELASRLKAFGVGKVWVEEVFDGRVNTFWEIDSGRPGRHLLFTGHLDTKPVCEGWTRDPFDASVEDARLFGHGVMDMKAPISRTSSTPITVLRLVCFASDQPRSTTRKSPCPPAATLRNTGSSADMVSDVGFGGGPNMSSALLAPLCASA